MTVREQETFPPVTLGHIRGHGCRDLLVYCGSIDCNHQTKMNADHLPDETPIRPLGARMVCSRSGHRGADAGRTGRRTRTATRRDEARRAQVSKWTPP
jgi:hypothetical protein